jgi:signal transduction histidine kinase
VIIAVGINYLYLFLTHVFGLANISGMADFVSLGLSLIFLATALISIYLEGMRKTNENALELAAQLSESVGELQVRIMAIRRRLAIRVHGDLQARLQGLVVLLSRFEQLNDQEKQHFFDELEQSQKLFSDSESQPVTSTSLEQLSVQWRGICEVNLSLGEGVQHKLEQDSGLSELVFEIARERVINAVKHSGAEQLDLLLEIRENLLIVRTVNDDFGTKKSDSRSPGTGSNLLDSACRSWHLKIESGVAVFEAEIELFRTRG